MTHEYYAHSLDGKPRFAWQPLEEYLKNIFGIVCFVDDTFGTGDKD